MTKGIPKRDESGKSFILKDLNKDIKDKILATILTPKISHNFL